MLFYSICYYHGKNKLSNLNNHLKQFKNLEVDNKHFTMVVLIDDINEKSNVEEYFNNVISNHNIQHNVIVNYNWGGTILGLWLVYQCVKEKYNKENPYVCMFEEDYGPQDTRWYHKSLELLTNDIIYIGETTTGNIKQGNTDGRLVGRQHQGGHMFGNETWTDGGYYFTTLDKLKTMEDKIGIFAKGNPNTKYTNQIDGINYGEVGFPTQLYNSGLRFVPIHRTAYFINEW